LTVMLALFCDIAHAQQDTIVEGRIMDGVTVTAKRESAPMRMRGDGGYRISTSYISQLPKIMGNSDPLKLLQMMPGIQVNAEYDCGIHIQGCDNSQNYLSIDGAPIYNASHILGFFSVFNPDHYQHVDISKAPNSASYPNRIGGWINLDSPKSLDSLSAVVDVGLMSTQGTLRLPMGKGRSLILSARASYLNLLYGGWLSIDGSSFGYNFNDLCARYTALSNPYNEIYLDLYHGNDRVDVEGGFDLDLAWGNDVAALHYNHKMGLKSHNMLYVSRYHNNLSLAMASNSGELPSHISTVGIRSDIGRRWYRLGVDLSEHWILPQSPEMVTDNFSVEGNADQLRVGEYYAFAAATFDIRNIISAEIGARGGAYLDNNGKRYLQLMPNASIAACMGNHRLDISYALRYQNIYQTGFSSSGLPTEFWYACDADFQPQKAHELKLGYRSIFSDAMFALEAELYYKRISNQVEYNGTLIDLVATSYDVSGHLISGSGNNYGLGLMLQKRSGKITGWLGYNYGRAMRTGSYGGIVSRYPANHDRPHEINAVATYSPYSRWSLGATYVYASGTPFTAPKYFYILDGNLMTEYGDHNANRLRAYTRMDLSVTYTLRKTARCESSINLSVYNVLNRANDIFYSLKYWNGEYKYYHARFLVRTMPSISYHLKF